MGSHIVEKQMNFIFQCLLRVFDWIQETDTHYTFKIRLKDEVTLSPPVVMLH